MTERKNMTNIEVKKKGRRKKELKKVTILFLQDFSPQIGFYLVLVWSPLSVSKRFLF